MFKNRSVTVKLDRPTKNDNVEEHHDNRPVEEKVAAVLRIFEKVAVKAFVGVCIYVALDTTRQVAVARASNPE